MSSKKQYKFRGKVYKAPSLVKLCTESPEYNYYFDAFVDYWRYGPHHILGRDVYCTDPDNAIENGLKHVHTDMGLYIPADKKDYTSLEPHWNKWKTFLAANDSDEWDPIQFKLKLPTSDSFIVYSINEYRDALVHDVIPCNGHKEIRKMDRIEVYMQQIYKHGLPAGVKAFPSDEYPFDEKWILPPED
ncbi:TPA: type II toxin-antitoxin system YafO family toxin [Providencia rettgeri]|nr:type II toxin-antitoxin system YafO family toxin [Providencia rettgeri]